MSGFCREDTSQWQVMPDKKGRRPNIFFPWHHIQYQGLRKGIQKTGNVPRRTRVSNPCGFQLDEEMLDLSALIPVLPAWGLASGLASAHPSPVYTEGPAPPSPALFSSCSHGFNAVFTHCHCSMTREDHGGGGDRKAQSQTPHLLCVLRGVAGRL